MSRPDSNNFFVNTSFKLHTNNLLVGAITQLNDSLVGAITQLNDSFVGATTQLNDSITQLSKNVENLARGS